MSQALLSFEHISKSFFGVPAVKDVSFALGEATILGIIGENGAGKSTLMNILGGVLQPDNGQIKINGQPHEPRNPADATRAGVAFIHQELNLFSNLTIAENMFIDKFPLLAGLPFINSRKIYARTKEILESIGLSASPNTPVEQLSPGERQLVEIGKALSANAKIIILDEPTTSLTDRETERLFKVLKKLRDDGKSLIYISHILEDVLELADGIVIMKDGEVVGVGPKKEFTTRRMISLMVGRELEQLYPPRTGKAGEEIVLEVKHLSQPGIIRDITFQLHQGEVLGVFGLMGAGRTELARILFGLDPYEQGQITVDGVPLKRPTPRACIQRRMAFVTENRREEGLLMDTSIAENLGLVTLPGFAYSPMQLVNQKQLVGTAKDTGGSLRIKSGDPTFAQPVKSLSGGNQQKVVIGKWVMSNPSVFIIDEPTRGIDVGAKYEVYSIVDELSAKGAGVLFISSELDELMGMCDRIVVMRNGEIAGRFPRSAFNKERLLGAAFGETEHE